ncbi:DUF1115 domain containing protein [Pseudohyphozyma bogoriensis]|nr:DUF1115 domain containing protein [Pseudohyphozyma bogoriensis]
MMMLHLRARDTTDQVIHPNSSPDGNVRGHANQTKLTFREMAERIKDELVLLRSSLLDREFSWDPTMSEADVALWEDLLTESTSPATPLAPPEFTVRLDPLASLRVQYTSLERTTKFVATIAAPEVDRRQHAVLKGVLEGLLEGVEGGEEYPLFSVYTALREHLAAHPFSAPVPDPDPKPKATMKDDALPMELKEVLLWSHHLLATGKRKNIVQWARELRLWGISKPGYPGVIVVEGLASNVDEFVSRIKALNWKALQVRSETSRSVPPAPPETNVPPLERETWVLRNVARLASVLGRQGDEVGVREVEGMGEVGDLFESTLLFRAFDVADPPWSLPVVGS